MIGLDLADLVAQVTKKLDNGLAQEAVDLIGKSGWTSSSPHAGLWMLWATALYRSGHQQEADEAFGALIDESFGKGLLAARNLAVIQSDALDYESCLDTLNSYRLLRPYDPKGLRLWAHSLIRLSRSGEAIPELANGRNVFPNHRDILLLLGEARFAAADWLRLLLIAGEGERRFGLTREIATMLLAAFSELGLAQAAARFVPAILNNLDKDSYLSLTVLGNYFYQINEYENSVRCFELATQCLGEADIEDCNRGFALLALGRFDLGWPLYHKRKQYFDIADIPGIPRWQGESFAGKKVLVNWEQGFGDSIQFMRFLPDFCGMAESVIFNAQQEILKLLPESRSQVDVETARKQVFGVDFQLHLADLPLICGVDSVEKIPNKVPYLQTEPERVAFWRNRLAGDSGLKVGLVWAGNPKHGRDNERSTRLSELLPLATIPGVSWISLQMGDPAKEVSYLPEYWSILDLSSEIRDYSDTAAIIENLDLVISVDTSVAHLAGALNKPVWILLPAERVDWRWGLEKEKTPWYPSAHLFRQESGSDWRALASGALREHLWKLVKEHFSIAPVTQDVVDNFLGGSLCSDSWVGQLAEADLAWAIPLNSELLARHGSKESLAALGRRFAGEETWGTVLAAKCLAAGFSEYEPDVATAFAAGSLLPLDLLAWADWLSSQDKHENAIAALRKGVANTPDDPRLLVGLAKCYQRMQGGGEEALKWLERAIAIFPRAGSTILHYVSMLLNANRAEEALDYFGKAIMLSLGTPLPWRLLAAHLRRVGLPHISAYILEALLPKDDSPELRCVLAESWAWQGADDQALEMLSSVSLDGAGIELRTRYAVAVKLLGDMERYDALLAEMDIDLPEAGEARHLVGWRKLQLGEFEVGWKYFCAGLKRKKAVFPEWQGESLQDKHILVYQEHGFGDLIQFLPLIQELAYQCRQITLALVDGVADIVAYQRLPVRIIAVNDMDWAAGNCDLQVSQMRLPLFLNTNLLKHSHPSPFLRAPIDRLPEWRKKIADEKTFKVGIIWAGNPRYINDYSRSTELSDWECLSELSGVAWYSFQKDVASNQALGMPGFNLQNVAADCQNWSDTACMMQLMDLIISVDSGGAHLAAGLAKPTWILLPPLMTDFRWQEKREDCPWYPTVRLFRQQRLEPWSQVLARVAASLRDVLKGSNAVE